MKRAALLWVIAGVLFPVFALAETSGVGAPARRDSLNDYEGVIEKINRDTRELEIEDLTGRRKTVQVTQASIGSYNIKDYVRVYGTGGDNTTVTQENNRHFEGRITNLDKVTGMMTMLATFGRERIIFVKPGEMSNLKVGDQVHVYLSENFKNAKKIKVI